MPDRAGIIEPDDVELELEQQHRETMLDLILAWASLDGALGMMLARAIGIPMADGAELLAKVPASARFAEMRRLMLNPPGSPQAATILKKHKKTYEKYSRVRNLIAHSHCAGIWKKDREFVVFATFEKVGDDNLAIDAVPLQEMKRATVWGYAMRDVALKIADVPYASE
jgi:hypothetical protein